MDKWGDGQESSVPGNLDTMSKIDPFLKASSLGQLTIVRKMIEDNPSALKESDDAGFTGLHEAVSMEQANVVSFLLQAGADANATTATGVAPLHLAASCEVVRLLLAHGADINARTGPGSVVPGSTPLIENCIAADGFPVMAELLASGALVNVATDNHQTALDIAIRRNEQDKIDLLRSRDGATWGQL